MNINIFVIVVALFLVYKIVDGYKKGMVKEIISFISLIFLCILAALIGSGLSSYHSGKVLNVAVVVLLLALLSIAHHLVNVVLFPAKLISKLPIVHGVDKILGVVVGILETVLIIWTIYSFTMLMDLGRVGEYILQCTSETPVLAWFYEHNQLAGWLQALGLQFRA
jgi:uncharacterized membrane protein required for colicin V production